MAENAQSRQEGLAQFASVVRRCRAGAGYADARAFFKALGGAGFFGCTYKAFAGLENGVGIPQPRLVERLVTGLRLPLRRRLAREFALAYLRLFLGSERFLELAESALLDEKPGAAPKPPREEFRLSRRQSALLRRDAACYWCYSALSNDAGALDAESLSGILDFPVESLRKALSRLRSEGLAEREASGRYRCPQAGRMVLHPGDQEQVSESAADLRGHWNGLEGMSNLMEHPLLLRASEAELRQFFPLLIDGLRGADDYATLEKGADTALFLIEARVQKLVSF